MNDIESSARLVALAVARKLGQSADVEDVHDAMQALPVVTGMTREDRQAVYRRAWALLPTVRVTLP